MSIKQRYANEISEIKYQIGLIRQGRIYEISNVQSDGYASTRADKMEEALNNLLNLIENDLPSPLESIFSNEKTDSKGE